MPVNRINSLEAGRMLAILAVMALHTTPVLMNPMFTGDSWFTDLWNQCMRFAVPLFFVLSGYFIQPRLVLSPVSTLRRYCAPLLKIWLAWNLIYLVFPSRLNTLLSDGYLTERQAHWDTLLASPLNSLFEGTFVHLWFIPALLCAVALIAIMARLNMLKILLPLAIGLYVYGLLAGSYVSMTGFEAPIFTRNGPFFSTLMVALGFEIRRKNFKVKATTACLFLLVGMLGHLLEALWLRSMEIRLVTIDYLLLTPIWAAALFLLLLNYPDFGKNSLLVRHSNKVLGVYLVHMLFLVIYINVSAYAGFSQLTNVIVALPAITVASFATIALIGKTPLRQILLR